MIRLTLKRVFLELEVIVSISSLKFTKNIKALFNRRCKCYILTLHFIDIFCDYLTFYILFHFYLFLFVISIFKEV